MSIIDTIGSWFRHSARVPDDPRIKHIFVLMLENRSFDNMLGFANWPVRSPLGIEDSICSIANLPTNADVSNHYAGDGNVKHPPQAGAPLFILDSDDGPGHEFEDVVVQLTGEAGNRKKFDGSSKCGRPYPAVAAPNDWGFITSYAQNRSHDPVSIMLHFTEEKVPILAALARQFAVCDHWFSSMPGPTWPNRFFIHAATSGGLYRSPSDAKVIAAELFQSFEFEKGTIFDSLCAAGYDWRVFHGDSTPQVFSLKGMGDDAWKARCHDFKDFASVIRDPDFKAAYVFIEPHYGNPLQHAICGTSQHPVDDVTHGEALIKEVYETLVQTPDVWEHCLLLITWDEHGGFFDHMPPQPAKPPGDRADYTDNQQHGFDFSMTGLRVPAIVVSPYVPAATVDHEIYDHTSLLATMEEIYKIKPLTNRDKAAKTFKQLLVLDKPRSDVPVRLPSIAKSSFSPSPVGYGIQPAQFRQDPAYKIDVTPAMLARVNAAMLRDHRLVSAEEWENIKKTVEGIKKLGDAMAYLAESEARWRHS
jgi:phospholipase C